MARRNLAEALGVEPAQPPLEPAAPAAPVAQEPAAGKAVARSTRAAKAAPRTTAAKPSKATQSPRKEGTAPQGRTARKTAQKTAQPSAAAVKAASAPREPVVRAADVKTADRVSLYLHPSDHEWIKYELKGGNVQDVIRTLIACARADDRLATKVARLSRTAPRGGKP